MHFGYLHSLRLQKYARRMCWLIGPFLFSSRANPPTFKMQNTWKRRAWRIPHSANDSRHTSGTPEKRLLLRLPPTDWQAEIPEHTTRQRTRIEIFADNFSVLCLGVCIFRYVCLPVSQSVGGRQRNKLITRVPGVWFKAFFRKSY